GDKLIAFLQTGQILLQRPNKIGFNKIAATLIKWGAEVDLKHLEEAYYNTRVLSPKQYESLIRLLTIFAEHLASCGNLLALEAGANIVNMSANYFSEKFKEATGVRFVEYVARSRVEKARNLLQNPKLRVSEVAFEVGFQSLSQFNRAFKKITGQSPSDCRAA